MINGNEGDVRYLIKGLAALTALLLLLPTLLFLSYDLFAFQSRRAEIAAILSKATLDERTMTPEAIQLVHISHHGRTAAFASRILIGELNIPTVGKGMLGWHTTWAFWWGLTAMHLSEQEQVAIIASRSYMGAQRYGYSAEALARFGRPLAQLSASEVATLIALANAPMSYAESPHKLIRRRDWLLSRLQHGS